MDSLKIAILQIAPTTTLKGNLSKGIEACEQAKTHGADLAVFPEMWSNGYERMFESHYDRVTDIPKDSVSNWQDKAIDMKGQFIQEFSKLAKKLEMAIAVTFLEKSKGQPLNSVILFDRHGKNILHYSKVHTVDWKMEYYTDCGDNFPVCELDYGRGKVKVGSMICNDRSHPEAARILMLNGAEVIIIPNACHVYKILFAEMKTRALENSVVTVMVNFPVESHPINNGNGMSCAYSPIFRIRDCDSEEISSKGIEVDTKIIEMGEHEEIAIIEIDLNKLREWRENDGRGNAYRKPKYYGKLLDKDIKNPFIRKYAKR
jgi:predicted amidohydrolase